MLQTIKVSKHRHRSCDYLRAALLPADVHLFIRQTSAGVVISDLPPCVAKDNNNSNSTRALIGHKTVLHERM